MELIVEPSGVLANDFDPDGDTLVVIDFDQSSTEGSVQVNPDGSFTYTC